MAASLGLEALPWKWLLWLDPATLLHASTAGLVAGPDVEEQAWRGLCAAELGVRPSQLALAGPVPAAPQGRVARWRRVFCDLDLATLRNGLRRTSADYSFLPSLYGEAAVAPDGVRFFPAATPGSGQDSGHGSQECAAEPPQSTSCQLDGPLGRNRCVIALAPLPAVLSATAIPTPPAPGAARDRWEWRVAYRTAGYYEVTLGTPRADSRLASAQPPSDSASSCISVGLCTPRLSRRAAGHQQAGWDVESWALRSCDGLLCHGSSRGKEFSHVSLSSALTGVGQSSSSTAEEAGARRCPRFREGDVIGCGIVHLVPPKQLPGDPASAAPGLAEARRRLRRGNCVAGLAHSLRRVFFTLNGELLGSPFLVDDTPPNVPLWPCVGIDAQWLVSFNFGQRPFAFDLDAAIPSFEAPMATAFDTAEEWPAESRPRDEGGELQRHPRVMPFTSKVAQRGFLGPWLSTPVLEAIRKYANRPRWLDPLDRLVSTTLIGAAGQTLLPLPRVRRGPAWLEDGRGIRNPFSGLPLSRISDRLQAATQAQSRSSSSLGGSSSSAEPGHGSGGRAAGGSDADADGADCADCAGSDSDGTGLCVGGTSQSSEPTDNSEVTGVCCSRAANPEGPAVSAGAGGTGSQALS